MYLNKVPACDRYVGGGDALTSLARRSRSNSSNLCEEGSNGRMTAAAAVAAKKE